MKPLLHLHFLSLLLLCCVSPSSFYSIGFHFKNPVVGLVSCHSHGIRALTQFKNEFDTRHCNHSDPFNGVWCDNSTGVVMYLQLRACLSGTLKPNSSLFQFHHLRYLVLSHNNFTSSLLSSQFGNINKLEVLILDSNGFLGQVPSSFNNLSFLSTLDLSQNKLTGSFPLIWNLTRLSVLDLSSNHFSGTLNPNVSLFMLHHLRYLNLGSNNFSSSLPSEFGNLENLEVVSLSSNGFFSQVPPTVSNLTRLTKLYLDQNKLTGNFQFVQNLTKLSFLDLHDNHFSGNIPSSLPSMPFLSYLDLCGNNLSGSIEIPNSTTSSRLEHLAIGHNNFKGNILKPISKLITLKHLDLSMQNISYPIDLSLFSSLQSLLFLDLSGNSISPVSLNSNSDILSNLEGFCLSSCGIMDFPNILKTLQKLQYLDISNNRITGKVPEWLWNLPHLSTLLITNNLFNGFEGSTDVLVNSSMKNFDLQLNHFEGPLPILPLSIKILAAGVNRFTGGIPPSICSCKSLTQLSLAYNNLTGPIPRCLSNLTVMDLRKNNLEGSIPDNFYVGASLRALNVGYNRLSGKLPRSLLNCSSLEFLNVDHNRIEDTFPFWLKALQNLQVLILRTNHFYGPISLPHQGPLGFAELRIFEISSNNFSGSLPPSYFVNWKASSFKMNEDGGLYMLYRENPYSTLVYNYFYCMDLQYKGLSVEQERVLTSYATIDFSGNRFEGAIPESLGRLKSLIALNLSNNAFTCHIPLSFANLGRLESLDLSNNQLSGTIPNGIGALSFLAYVNVSHNHLKGEIPQGTQITGQHKSSFEGNAGLCGLPLDESCFDTNFSPTQQPEENNEEVLNWKALVIGFGPGMLLGLAIAQLIASYKPEWLVYIIGPNKSRNR